MSEKKETYKLFNLPWYYFAVFAVVILLATKGHVWLLRVHDRAGHDSL